MKKHLLIAGLVVLSLVIPSLAQRGRRRPLRASTSNGCELPFTGGDVSRKPVKMRRANLNYSFNNGGRSISVQDWFALVCPLDVDVPARRSEIPQDRPIAQEVEQIIPN